MTKYDINFKFLFPLGVAVLLVACSGTKEAPGPSSTTAADSSKTPANSETATDQSSMKTINVKVEKLTSSSFEENVLSHGVTSAEHQITYSAEMAGKINYMAYDVGDAVKKGKTIARIDFNTLRAQADQARSNAQLAEATYERISKLKDKGLISHQQYDEALTNMHSAKAGLAIAETNFSKAVVKANHGGVVVRKFAEKGEYVGPGTPLYEVVDYTQIVVESQLAESQVATVRPGSLVEVSINALGETFRGQVKTVIPTADAVSKTFTARVEIPNADLKILVGMSATVKIRSVEHNDVLTVPQKAIIESRSGEKTAFVINDDVAAMRQVVTGASSGSQVIVKSGLSLGDRLVIVGHRDLVDGQPVNVLR